MNETLITPPYPRSTILHNFTSLLKDETGNIWTKVGNPIIKDNMIETSRSNYIYLEYDFPMSFTFSFDYIMKTWDSYYGAWTPALLQTKEDVLFAGQSKSMLTLYAYNEWKINLMYDDRSVNTLDAKFGQVEQTKNNYKFIKRNNILTFYFNNILKVTKTLEKSFTPHFVSLCTYSGYIGNVRIE